MKVIEAENQRQQKTNHTSIRHRQTDQRLRREVSLQAIF